MICCRSESNCRGSPRIRAINSGFGTHNTGRPLPVVDLATGSRNLAAARRALKKCLFSNRLKPGQARRHMAVVVVGRPSAAIASHLAARSIRPTRSVIATSGQRGRTSGQARPPRGASLRIVLGSIQHGYVLHAYMCSMRACV